MSQGSASLGLSAAGLFLLLASVAASAAPLNRVPRIGLAGDDLDACLSVGQVTGLNPRGDNYLTVRAEPRPGAAEKDRIGPGREVWLCDAAGEWLGVVYGSDREQGAGACKVGSPVASVRPYPGPCRWGWVHSRYIKVIAG